MKREEKKWMLKQKFASDEIRKFKGRRSSGVPSLILLVEALSIISVPQFNKQMKANPFHPILPIRMMRKEVLVYNNTKWAMRPSTWKSERSIWVNQLWV